MCDLEQPDARSGFNSIRRSKFMKPLKAVPMLFAVAILLPVSFSVAAPIFEDKDVLEHFDFFESFGNQGIEIDEENLTIMFLHQDAELGVDSYKSFRMKVVEPEVEEKAVIEQMSFEHDKLEFHLIPEKQNNLTQSLKDFVTYDSSVQPFDKMKAYKNLRKMEVPDKYRQKVKGGTWIGINNVRFTELSAEASKADKDVVTKIEVFSITQNPDGSIVIGIETYIPEEPIDAKLIFDREKLFPGLPQDPEEDTSDPVEDTSGTQASINHSDASVVLAWMSARASCPWSKFGGLVTEPSGKSLEFRATNKS